MVLGPSSPVPSGAYRDRAHPLPAPRQPPIKESHVKHTRTALASIAGLVLTAGMVTGAASLSAADPGHEGGHGPDKVACAKEQKQYDKAVAKFEELQAKFAEAKDEAEDAEGTGDEAEATEEVQETKKAKKAQAKRVEKKQAKLEKCQEGQEPTETAEPSETAETTAP